MGAPQLLARASRSGAVALSLANAAATAVGVVTSVIAARALGPTGRGDLAVLLLWPSLITSFFDSGLTDAVTSRAARRRDLFRDGVLSAGALGALGLLGGVIAVHLALTPSQAHLRSAALWALTFVPLSLLSCIPLGSLAGSGRFRALAAVRVGSALLYLVALAALAGCGGTTVAAVLALTVATRGLPLVLSGRSWVRQRASAAAGAVPELLHSAASYQVPRAATVLACNVDRIAAAWMLSQTDIGYWQVAVSLGTVVPFVGQAVAQEVFATGLREPNGAPLPVVRQHLLRAVAATALFAIVGVGTAPLVIPALFGHAFEAATVPAAIAVLAGVPSAASFVLQAAMKSRGMNLGAAMSEALGAAVVAVVAVLAVPRAGLVGLAAGVVLGRATSAAASYYGLYASRSAKAPSITLDQR